MDDRKTVTQILPYTEAKKRSEGYCAYQERSQQEVRDKLYSYGLPKPEVENLLSELIQANFLNEERFSLAYASGKFRIKGWGKNKIKHGLKLKSVSPKLIQKALDAIDGDEYYNRLKKLLETKELTIKNLDAYKSRQKLIQFALYKGYEFDLVNDALKELKLN